MEFTFTPIRIIILLACLASFALFGGFTPPGVNPEIVSVPAQVSRAWLMCVILYLIGAGCVSIVDHYVGNFPPSNFRILYVILGIILMVSTTIWVVNMKQSWAEQLGG